ncbi:MAG: dihydropteroate synthase [Arenicellales bacterium]|jgi:5-methyltetrahydrofolate--homocysteine methyltransferase|nr:dihydropteroate synthase [Arenicellales bacterium]MDP6551178.1 dihydropteroate synthase [Arenicellales bacterium]MDP6918978.1 dihydropteroate synthase [Arenicellales bacterium]|tara:strand:- start:31395 stop:32219 length:825 start_codon:yes stop_codon:yes gene_type:complete
MIIVGERINSTRKSIAAALEARAAEQILNQARRQWDAGASYLDVNTAMMRAQEPEVMAWVIELIQGELPDALIAIDSANPAAVEAGFRAHKGRPLLNSINGEKQRVDALIPLIREHGPRVIGLTINDDGISQDADLRYRIGAELIELLSKNEIGLDDIFIDPLIFPVSAEYQAGSTSLSIIGRIRENYPGVHTVCGLSNISFGLPERRLINQVYMMLAMGCGLDAAIIDPLDRRMMAGIITATTLLGRDKACKRYLKAYRGGDLNVDPATTAAG